MFGPDELERRLARRGWHVAKTLGQTCGYPDCAASWPVPEAEPLQRCPICRRWLVPLWKRDLPGWLTAVFWAIAGPTIAFLTVTILKLRFFPGLF